MPNHLNVPHTEAVLTRLFEVSNEPMTVTDLESGRMIGVNPAFAQLTGFTREELVGNRALDLGLWQGQSLPLQLSASLFDQDGVTCLVAVMRDVNARERRRLQYEAILDNAMV